MNTSRRNFLALTSGLGVLGLAACAPKQGGSGNEDHGGTGTQEPEVNLREFEDLKLDVDAWQYDKGNDCYYQLGLKYCTKPQVPPTSRWLSSFPVLTLTPRQRATGTAAPSRRMPLLGP